MPSLASARCAQTDRLCLVDDKKRDTRLIYVKSSSELLRSQTLTRA